MHRHRPARAAVRRAVLTLLVAVACVFGTVTTASADGDPDTIALPDGFRPEGIASGPGTTVYAGSLADGRVLRIDTRTGRRSTLVPGEEGNVAVGLEYDPIHQRLWVAGGPTGEVRAYDARNGYLLARFEVEDAGFLNDVAATPRAVYVTDSVSGSGATNAQDLVVIPTPRDGRLRDAEPERLTLTGDFTALPTTEEDEPVFNLNGIVAARGGRALLAVQSATGELFRIDPDSGETVAVPVDDGGEEYLLRNGDGLLLRGRTLYAVQNQLDRIAELRLDSDLEEATLRDTLTDRTLDVPTTVALVSGRLYAVNARFGVEDASSADYDIVRVLRR